MPHEVPDRLEAIVPGLSRKDAEHLAKLAVKHARQIAPKATGTGAKRLLPYFKAGAFGIRILDNYMWFQELGIKPFTMTALEGKTIPMWVADPYGKIRSKDKKAKTRTTNGHVEVLIFRRVGEKAQGSKTYPGAPGRIALRHAGRPHTTAGKVGGRIHQSNVGVHWRHPGLHARHFLYHGIMQAADEHAIDVEKVIAVSPGGYQELVDASSTNYVKA